MEIYNFYLALGLFITLSYLYLFINEKKTVIKN